MADIYLHIVARMADYMATHPYVTARACARACVYYDTTQWNGSTVPYKTKYELYYEPYFLGPATMPRYDERFWYGSS